MNEPSLHIQGARYIRPSEIGKRHGDYHGWLLVAAKNRLLGILGERLPELTAEQMQACDVKLEKQQHNADYRIVFTMPQALANKALFQLQDFAEAFKNANAEKYAYAYVIRGEAFALAGGGSIEEKLRIFDRAVLKPFGKSIDFEGIRAELSQKMQREIIDSKIWIPGQKLTASGNSPAR